MTESYDPGSASKKSLGGSKPKQVIQSQSFPQKFIEFSKGKKTYATPKYAETH